MEVVIRVTKVVVTDDNGGWCNNPPVVVGKLHTFTTDESPKVGDEITKGSMFEQEGVHGFGCFNATGTVVFVA